MPALRSGHYRHRAYGLQVAEPWADQPTDGFVPVPAQPGEQGERLLVAVAEFPSGARRGVLWDARIESLQERARELGPNTLTFSVPANPASLAILGDPVDGAPGVYHLRNTIAREYVVGSNRERMVRWRFFARDRARVVGDRIEVSAVGIVGGLTRDRIVGPPTRLDLLGGKGWFGSGTLTGWTLHGGASGGIEAGGTDGDGWSAWVTGIPGQSYLSAIVRLRVEDEGWRGRQWFSTSGRVKIPSGEDLSDYRLMSLYVWDVRKGEFSYPFSDGSDPYAAVVEGDVRGGEWGEVVTAEGRLPEPPYLVDLQVRLWATHPTKRTYFDQVELFRPENTSTGVSVDLTRHMGTLFAAAQQGRDRSPWGVTVEYGAAAGVSAVGTWMHGDAIRMDDALDEVAGQGCDVWDVAGPSRRVRAAKRRGSVRNDIVIRSSDILGTVEWEIDPGAQATAVRGLSSATAHGGADEAAVDTSQSRGQVIDVALPAPVGMTATALRRWCQSQLSSLMLLPATTTVLLPWDLGWRVRVGDTVRVVLQAGAAAHVDWMRVTQWVPHPDRRFIAVDLGTDPEMGGR